MPSVYGRHYYIVMKILHHNTLVFMLNVMLKMKNYICYKLKIRMDMVIFLQLKVMMLYQSINFRRNTT